MSQPNYPAIIQQLQEQLAVQQAQIEALLVGRRGGGAVVRNKGGGGATDVAKPQIFDSTSLKVSEFITVYKLYIRMKLKKESVEMQIQQVLSHMQRGVVDVWKENIIEELEAEEVEYKSAEEFLMGVKKKFRGGDKKSVKVVELKRMKQGG